MKTKLKILMVDDEKQFVSAMEKLLTSRGFEIIQAENGKKGLPSTARSFTISLE